MESKLIDIFHFFIRRLTGSTNPNLTEKTVLIFLQKISKVYDLESLGDWWCWWYISFQFAYWSNKKTRFNGNIPQNWIFGDKAIERWNSKPDSWWFYTNQFLQKYEIEEPVEYCKSSTKEIYEVERRRFHNTIEGFMNCQSFAKYSRKSLSCATCKFKEKCKLNEE